MAYIGNQSGTTGFSKIPAKQDLTGATGTSLTLTHAVASAEGIDLFINNVRQEPTEAYSVGSDGVTVTLTGSVVATDDIYVVYNSLAQQTSTHPSNQALQATSGTFSSTLAVTGATTATGGLNVGTIKEATGSTTAMNVDSSGIVTTPARPAFWAYKADDTGILAAGTYVFNVAPVNVGNCYNTTNGVFTAPVAGLYHFSVSLQMFGANSARSIQYYINGSQVPAGVDAGSVGELDTTNRHQTVCLTRILSLNADDEVTVAHNGFRGMQSNFCGFLLG